MVKYGPLLNEIVWNYKNDTLEDSDVMQGLKLYSYDTVKF